MVYCWRGGNRSGALATILSKVGWRISLVEGGYKAFRQHVLATMPSLVEARTFRVVCGVTGSGKTRFLDALARQGAIVLDLEKTRPASRLTAGGHAAGAAAEPESL